MRLIASSLMAGLIAFSAVAPAFADQRGRGHDRGNDRDRDRGRDRDWNDRGRGNDRGWDNNRRDDRRGDRHNGRGWYDTRGDHHYWGRGDRFEHRRHNTYVVVNDYNRYRLPPPRRGEYYYRDHDNGDILLVAAATGLVLWALTN